MSIRIPQNIIVESKYTQGNEYMFVSTYKKYQGYFYELNGKIFAGKEFNVYAPELMIISSNKTNSLLTKVSTYVYGKLSQSNLINSSTPTSYFYNNEFPTNFRYFISKINVKPSIIKEINEVTFKEYKSNILYASVALLYPNKFIESEVIKAESIIPGIKIYLDNTYTPGVTD
jgi:hypothetical protein